MRVLLDSSFLLLMAETGRDLLAVAEEALGDVIQPYILRDTINELKSMAGRRRGRAAYARAALKIAGRATVVETREGGKVDEKLLAAALGLGMTLATVDLRLISEAKKRGVRVLTVRRDMRIALY